MTAVATQPKAAQAAGLRMICRRDELVTALKLLNSVVKERTPKPILKCVKLATHGRVLRLHTTNLEQSLVAQAEQVQIESVGEAAVQCADLLAIADGAVGETIALRMEGEELLVIDDDSVFRLATMNPADMPPEGGDEEGAAIALPADMLARLIRQTAFAVADNSNRYAQNGLFLETSAKQIRAVATEGHVMALAEAALVAPAGSAILPQKTIQLMRQIAEDAGDAEVGLVLGDRAASLRVASICLWSNLVEGTFPPYRDVLGSALNDSDRKFTVSREALERTIRRASMLARDQENDHAPLRLEFDQKKGLQAFGRSERGSSAVPLPGRYEGQPLTIGMSGRKLLSGIAPVDSEEVYILLTAPNRPLVLKAGDYTFVCMPINLN